jgi:hypothetical protein
VQRVLHLQEWERIYGMGEVESAIGGPASALTRSKVSSCCGLDRVLCLHRGTQSCHVCRAAYATACSHRLGTMAAPWVIASPVPLSLVLLHTTPPLQISECYVCIVP